MSKLKIIISLIIVTSLISTGCSNEVQSNTVNSSDVMLSISNTKPKTPDNSHNIQLGFNIDLLKELSKEEKNVFFSSFSINQALTMAYFGADGATQDEIKNSLGYNDLSIEDVASYQKYLLKTYEKSGDTTFYSANSMWIDDQIVVRDSYIDTMVDNFDAEVASIDLQGDKAVPTLNKWIDKRTKGMITKLFDQPFDPLARLVLMNAIYFKGDWTTPFDTDLTRDMAFNGQNKKSTVDMMYSDSEILGHENDDYKAISMPYGDDERFHMVAVIPNGDLNEFIKNQTTESLSKVITTFDTKDEVRILFPKFELEEKVELSDTLKALGINTAFKPGADFSQISDTPLFIDEVLHKAKIKVDEEGTEAAAVTAIVMKCESVPMNQFEFIADKPFLFFIMDTENDIVLFTGVVYDLDNK